MLSLALKKFIFLKYSSLSYQETQFFQKATKKKKKNTTKTKLKIVSEIISTKQIVICYLDSYSTFPEILGVSSSQII